MTFHERFWKQKYDYQRRELSNPAIISSTSEAMRNKIARVYADLELCKLKTRERRPDICCSQMQEGLTTSIFLTLALDKDPTVPTLGFDAECEYVAPISFCPFCGTKVQFS
jgi:hypothetical protein